jgi:hypothetical protein
MILVCLACWLKLLSDFGSIWLKGRKLNIAPHPKSSKFDRSEKCLTPRRLMLYTKKVNVEFLWFFVCFLAYAVVFSFAHSISVPLFSSTPTTVFIIGVIRQVPTTGTLIALLLSILALLVWLVLGKPFGAKVPTGLK